VRGTVRGQSIYETAGTADAELAEAFRAKRETELYEKAIFGARAVVSFARAAMSYLETEPRGEREKQYVGRLVAHFGTKKLGAIDQTAADEAVRCIVGDEAAPATKNRGVLVPLKAILNHAARRGWCSAPMIEQKSVPRGKTRWLRPDEAVRLIESAAPHLRPLLVFSLGTGARLSEALELDWCDVHLADGRVIFRESKNGEDRVAHLTPKAMTALANMPHRDGRVFRRDDGAPYADRHRLEGGQIKTAFKAALRRAAIAERTTPHALRHTWATWFYAASKDLLLLKDEGGWKTLKMVERYTHLMPSELLPAVALVWGGPHPRMIRAPSVQHGGAIVKIASA
jgi:integrase